MNALVKFYKQPLLLVFELPYELQKSVNQSIMFDRDSFRVWSGVEIKKKCDPVRI